MSGPIERTNYTISVRMPPDRVFAALTDFGPGRTRVWRETSHPAVYRVHDVGDGFAEATEGVPSSWSRERYEWREGNLVTLTQLDSNVARNGTIRYDLTAHEGGTTITCTRYREFFGRRGRIAGTIMVMAGRALLKRQLRAGLDRYDRSIVVD